MNKFLAKIAGVALGLAMAIGVGVSVSSGDARGVSAADTELTFSLTSNPGQWPSSEPSTATGNKTYTLSSTDYTFYLGPKVYCNSGYLMLKSTTYLGLPAISGKKLTKVIAHSSSGGSVKTTVGISTGTTFSAVSGGAKQTWSSQNKDYTYTLTGTSANTMYYLHVSTANAQCTQLKLTYTDVSVPITAISVSPTAATITAGGTQAITPTITPTSGYTDTISWWSSDTNVATVSSGTITAIAQGECTVYCYVDANNNGQWDSGEINGLVAVTVEANTAPSLSFDSYSLSGYTGQSFSVTATFANLESDLAWSDSGTGSISNGSITWSSNDHRNGTSTYTATLTGEGEKTVVADATGVDAAQFLIAITQTTVDITKESTSIKQGQSETLAVSHNASSVDGLTWESDNEKVTVDSNCKVTVANDATVGDTATITATSKVDTTVSDTCIVTITAAPMVLEATFGTSRSTSSAEVTTASKYTSDYSYIIDSKITLSDISKVYPQTSSSLKFGSSSNAGSMAFTIPSTINSKAVYIVSVTVRAERHHETNGTTMVVGGIEQALTYAADDYTFDLSSSNTKSFTITALSTSSDKRFYVQSVSIEYAYVSVLDSVTTTQPTVSFTHGASFAYDGTLTAHYTEGKADATVTATAFKYGASTIDPATEGTSISLGDSLSVVTHNNQYVFVGYTEGEITKWTEGYKLTVTYAAVTSLTIGQDSADLAFGKTFDYTKVTVTIAPTNANPTYTWKVVTESTTATGYIFNASGLTAGTTKGVVVLRCTSDADSSKYADLTVTISGDPTIEITETSFSGYVGKGATIHFTYTNIEDEDLENINFVSSDSTVVNFADGVDASNESGTIEIKYLKKGTATISVNYDNGETLDSVSVTVDNDSVSSVTWSATDINVYSGATLSTTGWNVQYHMASGDEGTPASYTIKLGSDTVTAGYEFKATDDGKTMHVEYEGVSSSSIDVTVTQTINNVMASDITKWDFTIGEKKWEEAGNVTLDGKTWTMSGEDDGSPYFGYDATKGQQFGSGSHPFSTVSLQSSSFSGTIDSVTVYTSGASSIKATVQVSVGGTAYGEATSITASNASYTFDVGGKSGTISINYVNSSSKAIYIKEIVVNTISDSYNIANSDDHKVAQRAAVKFANAFNTAVANSGTSICGIAPTDGTNDAWEACKTAYNTFLSEASTDLDYAKNLLKYATRQYSDDSGEACIEKMMKTYEILVGRGYDAFMSSFVTLQANTGRTSQISSILNDSSSMIIVIISIVSITSIGGFFFLRKRKEY